MSKSLIRKNQLHPDIADLVSGYGDNFFVTQEDLDAAIQIGQAQVTAGAVLVSGNQTIGGLKNFLTRPTVSGVGVLLQGEATAGGAVENVVYTTGNQTINGVKSFQQRPFFNGSGLATTGELGGVIAFNGNRGITRSSFPVGDNVGGTDVVSFLNNVFFPFKASTISLGIANTLIELGTTYSNVQYITTITQNQETSISNLQLLTGSSVLRTIASPAFNTVTYSITPPLNLTNTTSLTARVTTNNNGAPTQISASQQVTFIAPSWNGVGVAGLITGVKNLTKSTNLKSNRTITYNSNNNHFYYAYPEDWNPLSSIIDENNFNITSSFTTRTGFVTLSDNVTNYNYRIYQSINPSTNTDFQITFNF